MSKKYFVFISSTQDLKTERRELIRIVTELGAVPITMDAFDITQEEDHRVIQKAITECDYFLNLTAHKRGDTVGGSFALECEYSLALEEKIPVIALIISEKARWKESKRDKDDDAKKALEAFKRKLESHTHDTWISLSDLRQKALFLLSREMNLNSRPGWVTSNEAVEPLVANELSRLIRENETLKLKIKMEGPSIGKKVREQIRQTLKVLAANRISLSFFYIDGENWENTLSFRYLRLFRLLAPELSTPKTVANISHFLGNILNPNLKKTIRKDFPTPSNTIKKIMSDFVLLKLIECAGEVSLSGEKESWELSEYGRETFAVYRLHQMGRALQKSIPKQ
jgi:hypothetical protein